MKAYEGLQGQRNHSFIAAFPSRIIFLFIDWHGYEVGQTWWIETVQDNYYVNGSTTYYHQDVKDMKSRVACNHLKLEFQHNN